MSYSPPNLNWHRHQAGTQEEYITDLHSFCGATSAAAAAWPTANIALYTPIYVYTSIVVYALWWMNGGTVSGNVNMGLYNEGGSLLVSTGSTAQSGTGAPQAPSITAFQLGLGRYWLALACDNTTAQFRRWTGASGVGNANKWLNIGQQTVTGVALPSTMTPAASTTAYVPLMGLDLSGIAL